MNNKLEQESDKSKYRHKGQRKTKIKTLMGEVPYERAVYEHIEETLTYINAIANSVEEEKEKKKLRELYTYFRQVRYKTLSVKRT